MHIMVLFVCTTSLTKKKAKLLTDQDPSLVAKEKKVVSVDGINGEYILLGSMEEVSMSGNWPKKYGNNE